MRQKFISGNWKMHKNCKEAVDFAKELLPLLENLKNDCRIAICPPVLQLAALAKELEGSGVGIGAQNVHFEDKGAFTGEISVPMLEEMAVDYCIIGHSERRQYFGETDETVNKKLKRLLDGSRICPILCVGESLETRESGKEVSFVEAQLEGAFLGIPVESAVGVVIAYEPIWAIGTGKTATADEAQAMCKAIRCKMAQLYNGNVAEKIIIQYGGSVKASNATEILTMPDIDGALVGGASLKPEDFIGIVNY